MSVNKIALSARTQMAREAAREYFIGVGKARKTISITKKAAINSLKAQITSVEIPILWRILKYRPRKYSIKAVKKKIRVQVKRSGGGATLDRAFVMAIGKGDSVGVFERKKETRYPIRKLFGPSVPSMLKMKKSNVNWKNQRQRSSIGN